MTSPVRIQRKRTKGWRMPEGTVYVGRPTKWGNPYRVHADGSVTHPDCVSVVSFATIGTHRYAVEEFRADLIAGDLATVNMADVRRELMGRDLACWCPLNQPCHADVLLAIANGGDQA